MIQRTLVDQDARSY